jgi:hypothetical protein
MYNKARPNISTAGKAHRTQERYTSAIIPTFSLAPSCLSRTLSALFPHHLAPCPKPQAGHGALYYETRSGKSGTEQPTKQM